MSLEKKGKFWIVSTGTKVLYRSHVRPTQEVIQSAMAGGDSITVESHTKESFDVKFPDDTQIKAALDSIDHGCDECWTKGGLPAMSYVEGFVGDNTITRRQVSAACPNLVRSK